MVNAPEGLNQFFKEGWIIWFKKWRFFQSIERERGKEGRLLVERERERPTLAFALKRIGDGSEKQQINGNKF